jgi:hypothetical protein
MTPCSNSTYLVLQAYIWEKPQVKSVDHALGKTAQRFKQTSGHFQKFSKISGQLKISGQIQDKNEISGI